MAKSLSKWLKEAEKLQKKEKKNPGKENKEKWKQYHQERRGEPIPKQKVVQTEEEKKRDNRSRRKSEYKKEIKDYISR